MRWRTNPAETRDGEKLNRPDRWIVPHLKRPGTSDRDHGVATVCFAIRTDLIGNSRASRCYILGLL
jgi:hypothetical protein